MYVKFIEKISHVWDLGAWFVIADPMWVDLVVDVNVFNVRGQKKKWWLSLNVKYLLLLCNKKMSAILYYVSSWLLK